MEVGLYKGRSVKILRALAEGSSHGMAGDEPKGCKLLAPRYHPSSDGTQKAIGLPGCRHTLLAHDQFFIYQDPQVLLCRDSPQELFSQSVLISGIAPTQVRHCELCAVMVSNCTVDR